MRRPAVVLVCGGMILMLALGIRQNFGLFLRPMSFDLGWGRETFSFAIALQNLVWGLAMPFAGAIADRFGAARVLVAGGLAYGLGLWAMAHSTGPLAFVIGDPNNALSTLSVSGASSDQVLVPNGNIVFGGSGSNRTVTVTPVTNKSGTAEITITVTDPDGLAASTTFTLTVSSHSPTIIVWNGPGAIPARLV